MAYLRGEAPPRWPVSSIEERADALEDLPEPAPSEDAGAPEVITALAATEVWDFDEVTDLLSSKATGENRSLDSQS